MKSEGNMVEKEERLKRKERGKLIGVRINHPATKVTEALC